MWWKIYFWILVLLTVLGLLSLLQTIATWNFMLWVSNIEGVLLVVAAYSYAFHKRVFDTTVWKYIFYIMVVDTLLSLAHFVFNVPIPNFLIPNIPEYSAGVWFFSLILIAPALVAVYRLGFSAKSAKKKK